MNVLLVGINSKYIHPAASVISLSKNLRYPNHVIEFTIKDTLEHMTDTILSYQFDLLGISTYIWNVAIVEELLQLVRPKLQPHQKIVLGGPEVSYDQIHFINAFQVDYIISGEAEESINELCDYLTQKKEITGVSNLTYRYNQDIVTNPIRLPDLKHITFGHDLVTDLNKRIVYFESSRGCPFRCSYCLASLESKVRHFDIEYVKLELKKLFDKQVPIIKFLDRTFNANPKYMLELLDFIDLYNSSNTILQFEIVADLLDASIIRRISHMKSKVLRFEIGIQSTNDATTKSVKRKQNFNRLRDNIYMLQQTNKVDLHLDLIAGLPFEDYTSFKQTFNDTLHLKPLELQLGFLKMLRGTPLRKQSEKYQYRYHEKAPYEIIENQFISEHELSDVHLVEECIEKYYNSGFFTKTIDYIFNNIILSNNYFDFFLDFGLFLQNQSFLFSRYQLDELFYYASKYIYNQYPNHYELVLFLLKQDYLLHFRLRPKIWWEHRLPKQIKNHLIETHYTDMPSNQVSKDDLYRYGHFELYGELCFVVLYHPTKFQHFTFSIYKQPQGGSL